MKKAVIALLVLLFPFGFAAASDDHYARLRRQMVERQIAARGIKDQRVLAAMRKVPRHLFVAETLREKAYDDRPLPIGEGQTISQPYIVALMSELLELEGKERVLEVGTGSGYQAAVLAELAEEVYTIEIIESLGKRAAALLKGLGYKNVTVRIGDGFHGLPKLAPFAAIIVTCAPPQIPPPLLEQLAEGGRLVIPVGIYFQELKRVRKSGGKIIEENIMPVQFVPFLRTR